MYKLVIALIALSTLLGSEANAASWESWICLRNDTKTRKLILVEDIHNYDWDGMSRPDHNWNGTYIEAGRTRCERAEVAAGSGAHTFSFIIDGRERPHKAEMWFTLCRYGGCKSGETYTWRADSGTKDVWSGILRGNGQVSPFDGEDWQEGDICDAGRRCSRFTIQNIP